MQHKTKYECNCGVLSKVQSNSSGGWGSTKGSNTAVDSIYDDGGVREPSITKVRLFEVEEPKWAKPCLRLFMFMVDTGLQTEYLTG